MAIGGGTHGGGSGSGTHKTGENITKTVSEVRADANWWSKPSATNKTPYTLIESFR